jgi:hypothetical protein
MVRVLTKRACQISHLDADFARMQKLQQKTATPAQLKAPPTGPRKFGNVWLPHKRPNVQNARAKLGIVTAVSVSELGVGPVLMNCVEACQGECQC